MRVIGPIQLIRRLLPRRNTTNDHRQKKRQLERSIDKLGAWMELFTFLVVLGLLAEYGPEILADIKAHRWPSLALAGGLLITVGVAGELAIEFFAGRKETDLREINNLIIAETEARIADRHVTHAQVEEISLALADFAGRALSVKVINENEAVRFWGELEHGFTRAAIRVEVSSFDPDPQFDGIDPGLCLFVRDNNDEFANAIEKALTDAGVAPKVGRVRIGKEVMLRIGPK